MAYASAYLKTHYLAAFTAALLNNQPMGFYSPATVVKDAQRHGLKLLPIDVTRSEWKCSLETINGALAVRLGLRYAKGLREEAARAMLQARWRAPFRSIDDLALRVPELRKNELALLAEIGALNTICRYESNDPAHRRDALWQIERAARRPGPLLEGIAEPDGPSPLAPMNDEERLLADFRGTGLTVGPHPMAYRRREMDRLGIRCARDLPRLPNGQRVRTAGAVIARQRPGTASGFVFLSLEDETGIANAIITPDLFEQHRLTLVSEQFLLIEGVLQNQDRVVSVKVDQLRPLYGIEAAANSHDFH